MDDFQGFRGDFFQVNIDIRPAEQGGGWDEKGGMGVGREGRE